MDLTNRQVTLIENLLMKYHATFKTFRTCPTKQFIFNGQIYYLKAKDYKIVCEIIDYIKGVKSC